MLESGRTRTRAALACAVIAAVVCAVPASATPPASLTATYTATQVPTSVRTAGGNRFVTVAETAVFSSEIAGDATATEHFHFRADGSFVLHAAGTCLCSVGSKSGTLEFQIQGGSTPEGPAGTITGAGSGDLNGLHLNGIWNLIAPGVVRISARYHFDG
jgi:hypothetical protein